jgi:allantoin racemase
MRFAYLVPGVGLSAAERDRRQSIVRRIALGVATVDLYEVGDGPEAIESAEDESAAVGPVVELARAHEKEYDAYIIGCFGDVGIAALRSEIRIPVVGPARATYSIAAAAYRSFAILSLNSEFLPEERQLVKQLGIADCVSGIEAVDLPVNVIINEPERALTRMRTLTERLDPIAVVPGCMSMAFLLEERDVARIGRAHVVNPLRCAVRIAAAVVV